MQTIGNMMQLISGSSNPIKSNAVITENGYEVKVRDIKRVDIWAGTEEGSGIIKITKHNGGYIQLRHSDKNQVSRMLKLRDMIHVGEVA